VRTWRWYSKVLFALLVAAFAYFVWPTPSRYDHTGNRPFRTHRVTGRVQGVMPGLGWRDVYDPFAEPPAGKPRPER
jgi:hypothetical protein